MPQLLAVFGMGAGGSAAGGAAGGALSAGATGATGVGAGSLAGAGGTAMLGATPGLAATPAITGGAGSLGVNFGAAATPTLLGSSGVSIPATAGGGGLWGNIMSGAGTLGAKAKDYATGGGFGEDAGNTVMQSLFKNEQAPAGQVNPNAGQIQQERNPEDEMNEILKSLFAGRMR
jgi:hypothetical protein